MTAVEKDPGPSSREGDVGPRVFLYGVGAMGSLMARMLTEKGAVVVGATARSPEKFGLDVGAATGLGSDLGVQITEDVDAALERMKPDVVVMSIASYMEDMYAPLMACIERGVHVISLSEELLCSWQTDPVRSAELDAAARARGVTVTCTGHQDGYWVSLVAVLMGTAHRVERVVGHTSWNVDDFGAELARDQQVGATVQEFQGWAATAHRPPTFGRTSLHALAAMAGLRVTSSTTTSRPEIAAADMACSALGVTVPAGRVIGFTDIDTVETAEGIALSMEMTGKVYGPDEEDLNEWRVFGEPDLHLRNEGLKTHLTTAATLVNRIPDVLAGPAGLVTLDQLPQLRHRTSLAG